MTRQTGGGLARPVVRRRLAAIPALVGIAVILAWPLAAGPASADSSPFTVTIDSPAGQTLSDATTMTVQGRVAAGIAAFVQDITVRVVRDADGVEIAKTSVCCASPMTGTVAFGPYTTPSLGRNGGYHVTVTASGEIQLLLTSPAAPAEATAGFTVAVPPAPPGNIKAVVQSDRSVLVSWSAVPAYPDFVGYGVYRKTGSGDFAPLKAIRDRTTTSFTDTTLGSFSGPVQYQVTAVREGAVPGDQSSWLSAVGEATSATVPPPPTTPPPVGGGTTTTLPPGGGLQPDGAATSDFSKFFSSQPAPVPALPSAPPATLPDTGYSDTLPFGALPSTTGVPGKVGGQQAGRSSASSGSGDVQTDTLAGVNRRALLVPVAAGSVLCVAALHLRWLNRRLLVPPGGPGSPGAGGPGAGGGMDGGPDGGLELEPVDHLAPAGHEPFLPRRQPVGVSGAR